MFLHHFLADQKIMSSWKQCFFGHPIGRFSEVGLHIWMPFVIFRTRSHERSLCHFQADFLSRHCFTLCIIMEAEPRIAKQYKCHHCCSCKNYWGKGMVGGKKSVFALFFGWPEDREFWKRCILGNLIAWATSYCLLPDTFWLWASKNAFKVGSVKFANSLSTSSTVKKVCTGSKSSQGT